MIVRESLKSNFFIFQSIIITSSLLLFKHFFDKKLHTFTFSTLMCLSTSFAVSALILKRRNYISIRHNQLKLKIDNKIHITPLLKLEAELTKEGFPVAQTVLKVYINERWVFARGFSERQIVKLFSTNNMISYLKIID